MTRGNILLVDDDPGFLTALIKTLNKQGYSVTGAANAMLAMEEILSRSQEFDLVITDLSMPMFSGFAILNAIKTAHPKVEVIVITAFADEVTQEKAMKQGAFAFVSKPLDSNQFLSVVDRALKAETSNSDA